MPLVTLRRIATAASTVIVAVMLIFGVQIAQLQTFSEQTECCCPDPNNCKCPDHKPDQSQQTSMRACHKSAPPAVTAQLAAFVAPALPELRAPTVATPAIAPPIPAPHPPPAPRRPDAPS
jgi:hypothetical protein